jgi:dTMP kinase
MVPDLTIVIDVPAELGLERAARRTGAATAPDRFEKEAVATHEKRREAFLEIAAQEPQRCRVVDGTKPLEAVAAEILALVEPVTDRMFAGAASGAS